MISRELFRGTKPMQPQQFSKERGLLGKLSPGTRKLEGKTFYLDNVKRHSAALLLEAVSLLGGKIESFLHKDVSFVVTGSLKEKNGVETREEPSKGTQLLMKEQKSDPKNEKPPTKTPKSMACTSRGKALLEKAIRNNERLRGSSVLSDARSWGVKILYVDDVLVYLKHLTRESFTPKHKRIEKTTSKQRHPAVKAAALRTPYLKIEDLSRRYRPLHVQSMAFPALFYSGRYSPFEPPPPPRFDKQPEHENSKTRRAKKIVTKAQDKSPVAAVLCNPSPWRPRKKDQSYCECCCETFTNLEEHLQSDQHRSFVLNPLNYRTVDQLVAEMSPGFDPSPTEETLQRPSTPLPLDDVCELDPLSDAEMERAVRALQRQRSSPTVDVSISAGVPLFCTFTFQNQADPTVFQPEADWQRQDLLQPRALSPVMPVLTPEPRVKELHPTENQPSDPYAFPPVLSPQFMDSHDTMEARSPYPEPPVLSPQRFPTDQTDEANVPDQTVPQPGPPQKRVLFGSDGLFGSSSSFRRRSNSLPEQSHKKRCRSVSSGHSHRKRRRTASLGNDSRWSELKPQRSCFLFENLTNPFSTLTEFGGSSSEVPSFNQILSRNDQLSWLLSSKTAIFDRPHGAAASLSTSVCIEPALIPDPAELSPSSSDSDWDCNLLACLNQTPVAPPSERSRALDAELLHRPCPWMHDTSYESHLHTALQPSTPAACSEDVEPLAFNRTVVQVVEVQH